MSFLYANPGQKSGSRKTASGKDALRLFLCYVQYVEFRSLLLTQTQKLIRSAPQDRADRELGAR